MSSHSIQFLTGTALSALSSRTHSKIIAITAAVLATGLLGSVMPAAAYPLYWPSQSYDRYDDYYAQPPVAPRKRHKPSYPKLAEVPKDLVKPKGPLVITISIADQRLKIYDSNGLFAETPVSTGMKGHSTPMGVFSIIQKSKWHRSNLYSDAPMPYMQRITWSGVALHAGVLPGYPASHGCIRMPMSFATKLWSWGKLGARVIIAPSEITPEDISHHLLATRIPAPVAAAVTVDKPVDVAAGKADKADATEAPAAELARMELRLTPKHDDQVAPGDVSDRVRLADARGAAAIAVTADTKPEAGTSPAQPAAPPSDTPAGPLAKDAAAPTEAGKDQSRPADVAKDPAKDSAKDAAKVEAQAAPAPKRTGHLAVFISRKEGRLYVRQNFEPLFDVPVTIAQSDRPLGTHVFTARADGSEAGSFRWSVVSPPSLSRKTDALAEDLGTRRKRPAPVEAVAAPLPPTASEALDRLTIPDDVMTKIASVLAPGASIIVSDQGLGGETGLGTDFIVPLR
ncbi:L,D-transpeptidase [Bradyrhizobium prioriisuperbiae]|uniref:L,D-transpeptidase n=1 Tax=Bradyrhizobium prioriisuperbiae TaxID=2854389 RepID=UPI0028E43025|nr:L,D-transpeptidase family protein [Bradyrhizobium prioritasuperba]